MRSISLLWHCLGMQVAWQAGCVKPAPLACKLACKGSPLACSVLCSSRAGVVEHAVLLGMPVGTLGPRWAMARQAVAGRLINGYTKKVRSAAAAAAEKLPVTCTSMAPCPHRLSCATVCDAVPVSPPW